MRLVNKEKLCLETEIEELREKLNELLTYRKIDDADVFVVSKEIDALVVKYIKTDI